MPISCQLITIRKYTPFISTFMFTITRHNFQFIETMQQPTPK